MQEKRQKDCESPEERGERLPNIASSKHDTALTAMNSQQLGRISIGSTEVGLSNSQYREGKTPGALPQVLPFYWQPQILREGDITSSCTPLARPGSDG